MRKTQLLLNLLNSLPVLRAQVYLPAEISYSQTPLNPLHDRKSIGTDLIVRQRFYHSLTCRRTLRHSAALQSP